MKYTTFSVTTFMVLFATLTLLAAQHTRHMFIGIGTLNPPRDSQAATSRDASTGGRNGFFGLARIVITDVSGDFEVHPYGFCSPTLCDWGMHPAFRFSSSVVVGTAIGFNALFPHILQSVYPGTLNPDSHGADPLLEVTTQSRFIRVDSRVDYEKTERFRLR